MIDSVASEGVPAYRPFQCLVCQSRFTRHENLKRHAALHARSHDKTALPCGVCEVTFSRHDLRHRHMKRKHPEHNDRRPVKKSRYQQAETTQVGDEGQCEGGDEALSLCSATSRRSSLRQQSSDEGEVEIESGPWHTELRYAQYHVDHGHLDSPENLYFARGAHTSSEDGNSPTAAAQLTQLPLIRTESTCTDDIVQAEAALEQSMLMGATYLKPPPQFSTSMHPMAISPPSSFDIHWPGFDFNQHIPDRLLSNDQPRSQDDWKPSVSQTTVGCNLFFTYVSHFVPFLHRPTFDATLFAPHLILAMLSLGYQYGEDPDRNDQTGSGASLSARCFHQARVLITTEEESLDDDTTQNIPVVQTYLLLQICAMMYLCGSDSTYSLRMHSKMISLVRAGGLMQPKAMQSSTTGNLESLWREFIKAESHKRTLFAVHQIDALWYQFLSIPRSISHLEFKHELPCTEDNWAASTSAEWAHRQLVMRHHSGPSVLYTDAVRLFLSPEADLDVIPAFDPYGAINIAQFLISSAREVSGWSTMTGKLTMERIKPLRSALISLSPFIHQQPSAESATHAALCEGTWEAAMIELQMWSPSHTSGIVEGSMDAVLNKSVYLAPSCEILCKSNTAGAIQPHVDWFLRYLDSTLSPASEAPWIVLYAYRAFLIAWNLLQGGISDAMQAINISDGDAEGALTWARKVFQRRQHWQLGKLILSSLDALERQVPGEL
ncbi:fungal-specific transcription factor domain-containing protein [Trichoderma evansii]